MKKKIVLFSIFLLTISTLLIVKSKNVIAYTGADKLKKSAPFLIHICS